MRQIHRRKNKLLEQKIQPLSRDDPETQIAVHWESKLGKKQHLPSSSTALLESAFGQMMFC